MHLHIFGVGVGDWEHHSLGVDGFIVFVQVDLLVLDLAHLDPGLLTVLKGYPLFLQLLG